MPLEAAYPGQRGARTGRGVGPADVQGIESSRRRPQPMSLRNGRAGVERWRSDQEQTVLSMS